MVPETISPKSRLGALLFCLFLGIAGVHRFYVGKRGTGLIMLLLSVVGFSLSVIMVGWPMLQAACVWALIDFILILVGSFRDRQGRRVIAWFEAGAG